MPTMNRALSRTTLGLVLIALEPTAFAESADSGSGTVAGAADDQLQEVIVTAQKRSENLQKVPIAITALTAQSLDSAGVTGTDALPLLVPSLNVVYPAGNVTPYIRGIGTQAAGAGNDNSVATYVDGVYLTSMASSLLDFNGIDRIEVLKGPQGTLFGRNTTGGVINVITRDPSADTEAQITAGYGAFQTLDASLYATGSISDHLTANVSYLYRDQALGWGRDLSTGQQVGRQDDTLARTKWKLTTDNTSYLLSLDYEREVPASVGMDRPFGDTPTVIGTTAVGIPFWDVQLDHYVRPLLQQGGVSLEIDHDFGFAQLQTITAYRLVKTAAEADLDMTPVPILNLGLFERDDTLTEEVQLTSTSTGPLRWVVGVFYLDGFAKYDPFSVSGLAFGAPDAYMHLFSWQTTKSLSAFSQGTYDITAATHLTVGARVTNDQHYFSAQQYISGVPIPIVNEVAPSNINTAPSWRLALNQDFTPSVMGYVSYNRGFRSGTYNLTDATNPALRPETIDAYEIGLKSDLFDRRLRLDMAIYDYEAKSLQLVKTIAAAQETLNAASARIYGADADIVGILSRNLKVTAGFGYTHARYLSFPDAPCSTPNPAGGLLLLSCDGSGNTMIRTPTVTASISPDYSFDTAVGRFGANLSYYYNDGWFSDPDNHLKQPSYHLLNATASWTSVDHRYGIELWGKNLTNTAYYDHLVESAVGDSGVQAPPRTYGITLKLTL